MVTGYKKAVEVFKTKSINYVQITGLSLSFVYTLFKFYMFSWPLS